MTRRMNNTIQYWRKTSFSILFFTCASHVLSAQETLETDPDSHILINNTPLWLWVLAAVMLLVAVGLSLYYFYFEKKDNHLNKQLQTNIKRLGIILKTTKVEIFIHRINEGVFDEYDENGHLSISYQEKIFFDRVPPKNRRILQKAMDSMLSGEKKQLNYNFEDGDGKVFHVNLCVLERDEQGKPTKVLGTKVDCTAELQRQQKNEQLMEQFRAITESSFSTTVMYNQDGLLVDMNDEACNRLHLDRKKLPELGITIQQVTGIDIPTEQFPETHMTQIMEDNDKRSLKVYSHYDNIYYELKVMPFRDDKGKLQFICATGQYRTEAVNAYRQMVQNSKDLQKANDELDEYARNLNYAIGQADLRLFEYSLASHCAIVYRKLGVPQIFFTQSRMFYILTDKSRIKLGKTFTKIDRGVKMDVNLVLKTKLVRHGIPYYIQLSLFPVVGENGKVTSYMGTVRDISEMKRTENQLKTETIKAQDVENVKDAFLRNMTHEIRTPLNAVVNYSEKFHQPHARAEEKTYLEGIKSNTSYLLRLVNDILFLSKLDAHMVEMEKKPVDMAEFFEDTCRAAWNSLMKPEVSYEVENPYNHLIIESDQKNLAILIKQIITNAAQHTDTGRIHARYSYTGNELAILVSDTGKGMSQQQLDHIFDRFISTEKMGTGLGLSICHEIATQMGGRISFESVEDKGTNVWVIIPCNSIEVNRK